MINQVRLLATIIVCSFLLLQIQASEKAFLVRPDFSEKRIGFTLKSNELEEYYIRVVDLLSKNLNYDVSRLRTSTIDSKKNENATLFVFRVLDYYVTYGSMGVRIPHMKSLLLRYGVENGYAFPNKIYFTNVRTQGRWGDNTPFESALDTTFKYLGNSKQIGRMDSIFLHQPIDDIINCNLDCAYTSVLVEPDFSKERMGYNSEPKEVFNFVHHLADMCGGIVKDDVTVIKRSEINNILLCVKNVLGISFDLIEQTMDFSILNTATKETDYHFQVELQNTSDWNENDEYSRKIEKVFRVVKRNYQKNERK